MKVEIEIPDLEELYCAEYDDDTATGVDFKKAIVDKAIEQFIEELYNSYIHDRVYDAISADAHLMVKDHSKEIIDNVTERATNEILKKKAIVEQMPKKSEIAGINKEWENYFIELIDKAIAKRFK